METKDSTSTKEKVPSKIKETFEVDENFDSESLQMINQYKILDQNQLGDGLATLVVAAESVETNQKFAIKIMDRFALKSQRVKLVKDPKTGRRRYQNQLDMLQQEIKIMKVLHGHPNVLKLYEVIDDEESDYIYFVLEYADGGQILLVDDTSRSFKVNQIQKDSDQHSSDQREDQSQKESNSEISDENYVTENNKLYYSEDHIRRLFIQIVTGLKHIHDKGVIHRDLKPQNILIDSTGRAMITDFGVSCLLQDSSNDLLKGTEGTFHFCSPECLGVTGAEEFSGRASDVWSLGVCLYCLAYLKLPFDVGNQLEGKEATEECYEDVQGISKLFEMIGEADLRFLDEDRSVSVELKDLLKRMIERDVDKRISLSGVITHAWMKVGE